MHYELYADSLWLLNFVMNLYLLILTDRSLSHTALRRRLLLGAAVGALCYLLPIGWGAPVWIKLPVSVIFGTGAMVYIAFRPGSVRVFARALEQLLFYSFLLGGLLLFAEGLPYLREKALCISGILGVGAIGFLIVSYLQERHDRRGRDGICRATLIRGGSRVCVTALLDTGNSLIEPVSGKPAAVIDEKLYRYLWQGEEIPFRAIPYCTIDKKRGILRGYVLQELRIETDGVEKRIRNVYVAVGKGYEGGVRMILNPALLEEKAAGS